MTDLNMMMREQARNGLNAQLDAAVTNGDTEAARKVTAELEKLAISTAPKAPPYGDVEVRAELNKLDWFGVDPKKTGRTLALGKDMDPKKFSSAEAFAAALVKAVDEEFKPASASTEPPENETDEAREAREAEEQEAAEAAAATRKPRRTDGPGEGEAGRSARRAAGPWKKMTDAPAEVQKEINRTADKFAPKTKEGREGYVNRALEAHYTQHQRTTKAGKK